LVAPASASADVRLPGPLLALAAGPGGAYAVVAGGDRSAPFRLVSAKGKRATSLGAFGSTGAEFADVTLGPDGPVTVFARPTSDGFAYDIDDDTRLGEGTGPPVLGVADGAPFAAFPDNDGDVAIGAADGVRALSGDGPLVRHAPLDAVVGPSGPLVLDFAQSRARTELRVRGSGAPIEAVASGGARSVIEGTMARDDTHLYVAYTIGNRLRLASAPANPDGRWTRRRLKVRGALNGAPAIARVGRRTLIATSRRRGGRRSIYLTTAGPAGTFTDRLTRSRGSDLAPLAAHGPDGRVYIAWTRRINGSQRRTALLRRVL